MSDFVVSLLLSFSTYPYFSRIYSASLLLLSVPILGCLIVILRRPPLTRGDRLLNWRFLQYHSAVVGRIHLRVLWANVRWAWCYRGVFSSLTRSWRLDRRVPTCLSAARPAGTDLSLGGRWRFDERVVVDEVERDLRHEPPEGLALELLSHRQLCREVAGFSGA